MLLFNQMKINKLTVSRDCAEPSTESMKPKLTFLFILTFLFLFSGSVGLGGLNKALAAGVKTYQDLMNQVGGKQGEFNRILQQYNALPKGHPDKPFLKQRINKLNAEIYGNDLQWEAEDTGIVGAVAYVNGGITYGDKNRIVFGDSKCNVGEQLFSFYTRANNKDIQT